MKLRNVKVAIATLAMILGIGAYLTTLPQVQAMFTPGVCVYYSSNKYRTAVGARGTGCCGEEISWGVVTAFRRCEPMYCLDVVCPNPEI
jgi:hypothetical protein